MLLGLCVARMKRLCMFFAMLGYKNVLDVVSGKISLLY
jgi:hypothetical protein